MNQSITEINSIFNLRQAVIQAFNFETQNECYQKIIAHSESIVEDYLKYAIFLRESEPQLSLDILQLAENKWGNNAWIEDNRARACIILNRIFEAANCWEKAYAIATENDKTFFLEQLNRPYEKIAKLIAEEIVELKKMRQWKPLIEILKTYLITQPHHLYLYLELCIAYHQQQNDVQALSYLKQAQKNQLNSAWIHDNYARIYLAQGFYRQARIEAEKALSLANSKLEKDIFSQILTLCHNQIAIQPEIIYPEFFSYFAIDEQRIFTDQSIYKDDVLIKAIVDHDLQYPVAIESLAKIPLLSNINQILNSDFSQGCQYWKTIQENSEFSFGIDFSKDWTLAHSHTAYIYQNSPHKSAIQLIYHDPIVGELLPVNSAEHYQIGGYFGCHRCEGILAIEFYDSDYQLVKQQSYKLSSEILLGGKKLSQYIEIIETFVIPEAVIWLRISLTKLSTKLGSKREDSYLFFTHLFFGLYSPKNRLSLGWRKNVFSINEWRSLRDQRVLSFKLSLPETIYNNQRHQLEFQLNSPSLMKNFDTVFNYQRSLFHWNRFRIQLAKACAAKNYSLMSEWVNDWLTIYPQDKNQQALAIVNQIELAHTEQGLFDAPTVEILQWLRYFTNLKPEAHYAWIWLIEISCQLKRWKEAQLAFKSLSKLQSLSAKMFAQLAEISVHLNDYDQAIYAYLSAWNSSFDKHYLTVISKLVSDHETIELSEMSLNLLTQLTQIYSDDVSLFSLIKDLNRYLPIQLLAKLPQGKLFAFERLTHLFVTVETDQDYDLVVDLLTELDQAQLLSTIPDWLAVELIWLSLNCVQNNLLIQQQKLQQLSIWSTVIQFDQQFPLLDVNRLKHREKLKMPIRSLTEFLALGTDRLLSPHILFNTLWYYNTEKLDPLSLPPLVHFFRYSNGFQIKITNPNPYFDTAWYRQSYLQEDFYQNPLLHYLKHFQDQNIQPCADFYSDYIRETQGLFTNEDSLTYYLEQLEANDLSFRLTGFSPCPWFERTFYLNHNQDINHGVNNSNLEPFAHFVNYGKKEGRLAYHWQKYNQLVRHQLLYLESFNLGSPITKDRLEYLIANDAEITYFAGQKILANQLSFRPLISILVPVFQVKPAFLIQMLDSVLAQTYSNWQLCLVDDASIRYREQIIEILTDYSRRDSRIIYQLREQNGHICRSSNDCFALAEGEFIALLDHDDLLTADALYEVVKTLNDNSDLDIIYSDEDKVDEWGIYSSPYYKPDWSPHTLWAKMYVCHLTVYRKTLIEMVHGFRVGFEGSQDYDLLLRCSENTQRIYHIPKVLYHWRIHHESTASGANAEGKDYCADAGRRAVEEALIRRGIEAEVSLIPGFGTALWAKPMVKNQPEIDILIPSRNASILLATCLQSIFNKSSYPHFKVTVIDNHSTEESFKQLMEYWLKQEPKRFQVLFDPQPFNFAKLNNDAVKQTQGDYLLFLNNDTEIISPDWLQGLLGYAQLPEVGAVGAKLYYADDTVQHAGVATGIGGVAGHVMKHFHISNNGYYSNLKMVTNYSAVTGACLMIQRDKFNAVNGFEEYLQVAFNDVDFCLKVREKGWFNVYLPFVELYHYESKSRGYEDTPEKKARFEKETLFLRQRWGKLLDNDPFYSPWLTLEREDMSFRFH